VALARRVTEVHAAGDFSFRNKRFTGDRWVLAGDAAGLLIPFWSSGVFIAVLSGEKAADMLDPTLRQPQRRAAEFARYEQPRWPGHGSVLKVRDHVVYPRVYRPCSKS
jgi:flavin-dependent dehydrogenase